MKTIYINEKGKITKRKIKRIAKKINKINIDERVIVAICKELIANDQLIQELNRYKIPILDRKMAF